MSYPEGSRIIRRDNRPPPSPLRHAIFAGLVIFSAFASAYAASIFLKKTATHENIKKIDIVAAPVPDDTTELSQDTQLDAQVLPDLLGEDVAQGENPTDGLAGASSEDNQVKIADSGSEAIAPSPRFIRINGQLAGRDSVIPLIKAPIEGLSRQSPYGNIPTKSNDGDTAFLRYAKSVQTPVNAKTVAIIIGGLGLNPDITTRAILELPPEVTLSFAAHTPQLQNWINRARENGHEVLLEIPMQTNGVPSNEANRTLTVTPDIAANTRRLDWLLSRASGYFGVTNYNGDEFMSRSDLVAPFMTYLEKAGLSLIFDGSFEAVALPALATSSRLPYIEAELVLDVTNDRTLINANLDKLADNANEGGAPIGIGFAYQNTINAVTIWAAAAPEKGLVLVPASHLMSP